jgi:hypothetical protein
MSVSSRWHDAEAMLAQEASWVTSPRWPTVFIGLVLAVILKLSGLLLTLAVLSAHAPFE